VNRALLAAGLVDRLGISVFPIITGASGSDLILAGLPDIDLELVDARLQDGRIQQLVHMPTVLESLGSRTRNGDVRTAAEQRPLEFADPCGDRAVYSVISSGATNSSGSGSAYGRPDRPRRAPVERPLVHTDDPGEPG
jgi:hypothetical protein